jgi:hypothetical protein
MNQRPAFGRLAKFAILPLMLFAGPGGLAAASETNVITCELTRSGPEFRGACSIPCAVNALAINIDGPRSGFSCATPNRVVNVTLRQQEKFDDWLGSMQGKEPEDPTRFGVLKPKDGKPGVARTPYGWFALTEARADGDSLKLTISANRQLPPTPDDLKIIARAIALIPNAEVWSKEDNRQCPPGQTKISLFCAMMLATTEVSGGVHYRQPAMQAVREVLNEVGGDRVKLHRIMDYNNHADTTLEDIHALLRRAEAKLKARGM